MNSHNIIVVEDEPKIAQLLVDYLERDGFSVTVLNDGKHAVEMIREAAPGFVILDLMLPGKDGLAICREVRQFSGVPILMLTAKVDEIDRLVGLELGADDYVCKPFSPREVVARVRTIQRRLQQQPGMAADSELSYRDIIINIEKYECSVRGQRIEFTPVEFQLLRGFVSQPGRVFSRDQLMDMAYSDERVVSDRTIDTHVKNIRRKLSQAGDDVGQVHSIYGVGYKLE